MGSITFWAVISLIALVIDIATNSFFFAGFTVGGIGALIAKTLNYGFLTQMVVFLLLSTVAIIAEYVWLRKWLRKTIPKTPKMEEEYIGRKIVADEDIEERGKVKVEGIYWTVENSGEPIRKGEKAEIVGIKGNKLIIRK